MSLIRSRIGKRLHCCIASLNLLKCKVCKDWSILTYILVVLDCLVQRSVHLFSCAFFCIVLILEGHGNTCPRLPVYKTCGWSPWHLQRFGIHLVPASFIIWWRRDNCIDLIWISATH